MSVLPFDPSVSFDHAAAHAFVECCDRAVAMLEEATERRWAKGNRALAHCVGPFADKLAADLASRCEAAACLVEDLLALRRRVVVAQAEAVAQAGAMAAIRSAAAQTVPTAQVGHVEGAGAPASSGTSLRAGRS